MKHLVYLYRDGKPFKRMLKARIIGKSHVSLTGILVKAKDGILKSFEAPLERDFLTILDFDWNVASFYDQPVKIRYQDETGKRRTYTPDVLVHYRRGLFPANWMKPLLVEIKTKKDLAKNGATYLIRFSAAKRYAEARGWEFRVLTEDDIRTPYLSNAVFLREFRQHDPIPANQEYLRLALQLLDEDTAHHVIEKAAILRANDPTQIAPPKPSDPEAVAGLIASLWRMVTYRIVQTDLTIPLTMDSLIWLPDENDQPPEKLP